jgi:hypothetical protein
MRRRSSGPAGFLENVMPIKRKLCGFLVAAAIAALALAAEAREAGTGPRDGSHDFDFARGVWHTHVTRILDPFEGGTHTTTLDGTKTSHPLWDGRAWVEEIEADGPDGHWEGMTLFVYNPKSDQWSQTYIDGASGDVESPSVGAFKDGRGELYATGTYDGRNVLVRGVWSDITPISHRYEIAYSQDGGRTWATAFKAYLTRLK